jgi:AbiV family abortive infection protein
VANEKTPVTSLYLLQGAVYAFEQCGYLLSDARSLYKEGSYGTVVALTAFAHEELGRAIILLDLRAEVVAGKTIIADDIRDECDHHVTKQQRGALSTTMRTDRNSGLGKLLEVRLRSPVQSEEWKQADRQIRKIDEIQRKRAPVDRHKQRMRAIYVEPGDDGGWNRPKETTQTEANRIWTDAANDYRVGLQKIDPGIQQGADDQLVQELEEWSERPTLTHLEPLPFVE